MDYRQTYEQFSIDDLLADLDGDLQSGFNVAEEGLHRHPPDRLALVWRRGDERREVTYGELSEQACAAAAALADAGVGPGDRVAVLLPKRPELLTVAYAAWHLGAVYLPLFTAFGPEAIGVRLSGARPAVLITDREHVGKTEGVQGLPRTLLVDDDEFAAAQRAPGDPPAATRRPADKPFILLYTSGTTGDPKGVPIPLRALPAFLAYMQYAVDLRDDDRLWNMADPGWAYGLYYGVVGPMLLGQTIRLLQEPFDPARVWGFLAEEEVTNLCSSPTAYRGLRAHGVPSDLRLSVRVASSAGEPLEPEVMSWFEEAVGARLLDQYGQTEVGMIVCNHHRLEHPVTPGAMGYPMPGFRAVVVDDDKEVVGQRGDLAVDVERSPLHFFPGYFEAPDEDPMRGGYYRTGDLAEQDEDGVFRFASRADDVIISAGYRIGPFEVESQLAAHPVVAEAAVVGKPDSERGEVVVAFVILRPDHDPSDDLAGELQQHVKRELSAHAYPREVHFVDELPRTPSGKVQRYRLRDQLDGG